MNVRGPITSIGDERSAGGSSLVEVTIRAKQRDYESTKVTLWGDWTHTAEHAEPGMELLVTDVAEDEFQGRLNYETTPDSYVVVEPGFIVDVTNITSWVQCPRMYYLNKLGGTPLEYPVIRGSIIHEVFADLLQESDPKQIPDIVDQRIEERVTEAALGLDLLGYDLESVVNEARRNVSAIEGWLQQARLDTRQSADRDGNQDEWAHQFEDDGSDHIADGGISLWTGGEQETPTQWRSEESLISPTFGMKGRADAIRQGNPVELKTGKNLKSEPRFEHKVQAACYGLLLREQGYNATTGTVLYTKNAALDSEEEGDVSPAKDFSITKGFLDFIVRKRNEIAAMEYDTDVPTGYEADAICEYCFEQDSCLVISGRLDQESKAGQIGDPVPKEERKYFDLFYNALEAEREAVHTEYRKLWEQEPEERAADDRALIGLDFLGGVSPESPIGPDNKWELYARKDPEKISKLREGDLALASDGNPVMGQSEFGEIIQLGGTPDGHHPPVDVPEDELVVVRTDEPIQLRRLDVYPMELTIDRSITALHDAILKSETNKDVLFGREPPTITETPETPDLYTGDLNEKQTEAVKTALAADDYAIIHGPPGTGKTFTIAELIRSLVADGNQVLLGAFTNNAVDNALEELRGRGLEKPLRDREGEPAGSLAFNQAVIRMGSAQGIDEEMEKLRLEERAAEEDQARMLSEAPVVAATAATCGSRVMRDQEFDVAIVDEASQLTEPATLAAINRAERFVLVGDDQQLPPVVQTEEGVEYRSPKYQNPPMASSDQAALSQSLFERLNERSSEVPDSNATVMLNEQYRMSQRIQWFSSREFYDGNLKPANSVVAGRSLDDANWHIETDALPESLRSVGFIDPDGTREGNKNPAEARRVVGVVEEYIDAGVSKENIGVITPFRAQVAEIDRQTDVTVDTVDRFQGKSKDVIIVSFVATGSLDSPVFENRNRVNVALTRAKRALTLVGDEDALRSNGFYERMLKWAQ